MILLDTDTFTLLRWGPNAVTTRAAAAKDVLFITVVTRIEVLRGRFEALMKAADGVQLQQALGRLIESERELEALRQVSITDGSAAEFDRLRQNKRLKKIGRADLLIASIALANQATLVSRNLRDFRLVPGLQVENWAD